MSSGTSCVGAYRTERFVLDAVREFVEPLSQRSVYKMSRLAVLHDGSTVPVLTLLAKQRFPQGWEDDQFPFWIDGDRRNEMLVNVGLATRATASAHATEPRSAYGVPAGTKEYMKLWRAANRERVRASQKRYADKQRTVLDAAVAAAETDPVLEKLLAAVRGEKEKV